METRPRERIRDREVQRERERNMSESEKSPKSGSKKGLIVAFIIFMLAVNGVLIFLNFSKNSEIEEKEVTIVDQKKTIDAKTTEINGLIQELNAKKQELAKYGADTMRLYTELENVKERLRSQENVQGAYNRVRRELENLKLLASQTEVELGRYKAQVDTLQRANADLKSKITETEQSITTLQTSKEELTKKVELAAVLKAENMQTWTLSAKGKEREGGDYKAKDIDILRMSFLIGENRVAKAENKEILMRVLEPEGGALFDLASGGGSFMYQGREVFYTQKQDVLYDNKSQQVTFDYKKGSEYKPGEHKIEVYSDGIKIGETTFNVR